ncbi:MAG: lipopolysaccharide biosynthesis protein [Chloroflexales bacterium]|nr:lipopolysaccharide biosynthesis protein [Chloroflexales bacterium]
MSEEISQTARPAEDSHSLSHRTLRGLFWMFSGTSVNALARLIVLVVLARLLEPTDFGIANTALIVVGFAGLQVQLGLEPALVQRPELTEAHLRTAFTVFTALGALMGLLIAALAPQIAAFFSMDGLAPVLVWLALVFPLQGAVAVPTALLKRGLRFRLLAAAQVISYTVGYGVIGIALALLGAGVWALVGANLAQAAITSVALLIAQPYPRRPMLDRGALGELLYFGGGFTLARLLNYAAIQGDNFVAGRSLGAEALGIYGRAYQLLVFPVDLLGAALDQVLFPSMAKVQSDPSRLMLAYRRGVALIAMAMLPLSAAAVVLAPELIRVLLGPRWEAVVAPFQILALGLLFRTSYKMSDALCRATGAVYKRAWRQSIYALLIIGGAAVGQRWGVAGIAVGTLFGLLVNFLAMAQLSLRLTAMSWGDFFLAHRAALWITALVALEAWLSSLLLRGLSAPAIITLAGASAVCGLSLLGIVCWAPQLLGPDNRWMRDLLIEVVRGRYRLLQERRGRGRAQPAIGGGQGRGIER